MDPEPGTERAHPAPIPAKRPLREDNEELRDMIAELYLKHTAAFIVDRLSNDGFVITEPIFNKMLSRWKIKKNPKYPSDRQRPRKKRQSRALVKANTGHYNRVIPSRTLNVARKDRNLSAVLSAQWHWYDEEIRTKFHNIELPTKPTLDKAIIMFNFDAAITYVTARPGNQGWKRIRECCEHADPLFLTADIWTPISLFFFIIKWQREGSRAGKMVEKILMEKCFRILGPRHPISMAFYCSHQGEFNREFMTSTTDMIHAKFIAVSSPANAAEVTVRFKHRRAQLMYLWKDYDSALPTMQQCVDSTNDLFANVASTLLLANHERERNNLPAAIALLTRYVQKPNPDKILHPVGLGQVLRHRGNCYLQLGDAISAEMDLRDALTAVEARNFGVYDMVECVSDLIKALKMQKRNDEADGLACRYAEYLPTHHGRPEAESLNGMHRIVG